MSSFAGFRQSCMVNAENQRYLPSTHRALTIHCSVLLLLLPVLCKVPSFSGSSVFWDIPLPGLAPSLFSLFLVPSSDFSLHPY